MTNGIIPRLVQPKHEFYNDPFIMTCHGFLYCTFYWLSHLPPLAPQNPFLLFFYLIRCWFLVTVLRQFGEEGCKCWCSRVQSFPSWRPTASQTCWWSSAHLLVDKCPHCHKYLQSCQLTQQKGLGLTERPDNYLSTLADVMDESVLLT